MVTTNDGTPTFDHDQAVEAARGEAGKGGSAMKASHVLCVAVNTMSGSPCPTP